MRSCYDEGKRTAETLTMDYHRGDNVEVTAHFLVKVRCFEIVALLRYLNMKMLHHIIILIIPSSFYVVIFSFNMT